jgi:hypothetical protein
VAAKRSITNLRVRGTAQFDREFTVKGTAMKAFKCWIGQVKYEEDAIVDVIEIANTLGGPVTWERVETGVLRCTRAGAFTADKTTSSINLLVGVIGDEFFTSASPAPPDSYEVVIYNQSLAVSAGGYFFIEIKVFA